MLDRPLICSWASLMLAACLCGSFTLLTREGFCPSLDLGFCLLRASYGAAAQLLFTMRLLTACHAVVITKYDRVLQKSGLTSSVLIKMPSD